MSIRFFLKPFKAINPNTFYTIAAFLSAVFLLLKPELAAASGEILIAPYRVVFQDQSRVQEVAIVNTGDKRTTYRISLENKIWNEVKQGYDTVTEPRNGERFADQMIRLSVREVTLDPQESQTIKMQLRKPEGILDGEYRTHLAVRAVPEIPEVKESEKPAQGVVVKLVPVYGLSIPIFVRVGALQAEANVKSSKFMINRDKVEVFNVVMERKGDRTIYGNLDLFHQGRSGKWEKLLRYNALPILWPYPERSFQLGASPEVAAIIKSSPIKYVYTEIDALNNELPFHAEGMLK